MFKLLGLTLAIGVALAVNQANASLSAQDPIKPAIAKPSLPVVACRAGLVYYAGGVFAIYGTRGGRTGVVDVLYVDAGCYQQF